VSQTSLNQHTDSGAATLADRLFADVLCGVDGTRSAYEAVRQAAALTGPGGHLTLLAATAPGGSGRGSTLGPMRARTVLDHARRLSREAGVGCDVDLRSSGPALDVVLESARRHALLALGAPGMSRLAHMLVGGIATPVAHALPCSLLFARRAPAGMRFDERVMVASDALDHSDALVDFAAELARRRGSSLVLFHAAHAESDFHPTRIAAQTERLRAALGERSSVRVEPARAFDGIVQTADAERVSLIVLASRRASGLRALGSVSERVVHDAPCSVLVLRPEDLDGAA